MGKAGATSLIDRPKRIANLKAHAPGLFVTGAESRGHLSSNFSNHNFDRLGLNVIPGQHLGITDGLSPPQRPPTQRGPVNSPGCCV